MNNHTMMALNGHNVQKVFLDCLFKDEEIGEDGKPTIPYVEVQNLTKIIGFHPDRLEKHRQDIIDFCQQLPEEFRMDVGGGWSFLKMVGTKDEYLWGGQENANQLLALGLGIKIMKILLPRELWIALPGGVPYIGIDFNGFKD